MVCDIKNIDLDAYTLFITQSGNLFQQVEWITSNGVKEYFPIIVKNNSEDICIAGTYIFIVYNGQKSIYFPRGPVFSSICKETDISEFISYIKLIAQNNKCKNIIFDSKYQLSQLYNCNEIEGRIIAKGFKKSNFSRFWHYNWGINISDISIDEYLLNLKQKTRYNINYAKKMGLKVTIDNSENSIKKFYELLKVTASRDNFKIKEFAAYLNLFENFKDNIKLFWVYKDKILLSAAIYIIVGNQAYYVYGASSSNYREYKPTYLMQYAMIKYSIEKKCKTYNMGGVGILNSDGSVKMNKGLYDFKKKFGGFIQDSSYTYILEI